MDFLVNDKKGQKDNSSVLCIIVKNLVNVTVVPVKNSVNLTVGY